LNGNWRKVGKILRWMRSCQENCDGFGGFPRILMKWKLKETEEGFEGRVREDLVKHLPFQQLQLQSRFGFLPKVSFSFQLFKATT
jgi:hypothetical protein